MRAWYLLGGLVFLSIPMLASTAPAGDFPPVAPATHEELGRSLDELAAQIHGLGERWRGHFSSGEPQRERPLISLMLHHRQELGLSAAQVEALERLRADFQRDAVKRDADVRVAEMDLAALLRAEPVDLGKVEAKVREIERLRGDLRLARIRVIEQGKGQLTAEQRAKLGTLAESWPPRPGTGMPLSPPPPPPARRM
jgi:Spy/CpxP family protein refolding chaperone